MKTDLASLLLAATVLSLLPVKADDNAAHTYPAQGVIEKLDPAHHQLTIHHHAIPGYMMEMTMDFPVKDDAELKNLAPGDEVTFNLVVDPTYAYVRDLHRIGHASPTPTPVMTMAMSGDSSPLLRPGDPVPDMALRAEDGRTVHLADFRGKAVALTFFFTRCPLPNYCPMMNHDFSAAQKLLLTTPGAPKNWQLLSISFDADFDTPQTLTSYAALFRGGDTTGWLFASASPAALAQIAPHIGLMIMGQDGNLTHNLRTLVIDPQGRLVRQFNDNSWTPRQLVNALTAADRAPAK
jgi:protein SCO1/2